MNSFASLIGAVLALAGLFWAVDAPTELGWFIYQEQFIAAALGASLFMTFMSGAAGEGVAAPSRWPLLAAFRVVPGFIGLAAGLWLCVRYPVLQADVIGNEAEAVVLSVIILVLALEACRLVVVKSAQQFRPAFETIATRVIYLRHRQGGERTYRRVRRPIWPICPQAALLPSDAAWPTRVAEPSSRCR